MIEEGRKCRLIINRSEIHFLIDCNRYKYKRYQMYDKIENISPNFRTIPDSRRGQNGFRGYRRYPAGTRLSRQEAQPAEKNVLRFLIKHLIFFLFHMSYRFSNFPSIN